MERNFRFRRGEIDLIARKGQLLLFVEVKARTGSAAWGYPEEAVDHKKVQQIIRCANGYIFQTDWRGEIRFDIIAVEMGKDIKITHFEDAFH